jgi:hypothetical protein
MSTITFTCPHCTHTIQLPDTLLGKQGKCSSCNTVVTIIANAPANPAIPPQQQLPVQPVPVQPVPVQPVPVQPATSDSIIYEPSPHGTYLLHRISEQTPDSPLSHLTFIPGTFEQDGSPYYFMTDDGESGFLVYESISGIDGNDQVLLVMFMALDISYADVSKVYDAFTLLQDNTAYECSSSWMVSPSGNLGLKTSVSLLPLMKMSTLDLQLHVNHTIQLFCGRVGEFCHGLSATYEAGDFVETGDSVDAGEVVGKILKFGLDVFLG